MPMASREASLGANDFNVVMEEKGRQHAGLSVLQLTLQYGAQPVLRDLSLTVEPGEFLTLLGNSGCGKTTLLRAIAGFVPISTGRVLTGGKDITHVPMHRRAIGFVHQQYALFPHLTVFENVAFGLRERKMPRKEIQSRVLNALHMVHLDHAAKVYPSELSGGMQQRVALARTLVLEPDILLLDEPLSALDTNLRVELRRELQHLHRQFPHMTVINVTHDREEAMTLSHRIALMHDGRIVQCGTPMCLYDQPKNTFVASYLGVCTVLDDELSEIVRRRIARASAGDGSNEKYLIRAERIRISEEGPITIPGRVEFSEWMGAIVRLRVCSDRNREFIVDVPRTAVHHEVGDRVTMSFAPEDCLCVDER